MIKLAFLPMIFTRPPDLTAIIAKLTNQLPSPTRDFESTIELPAYGHLYI